MLKKSKIVVACSAFVATSLFFSCGSKIDKSTPENYFKSVMVNKVETLTDDFNEAYYDFGDFSKSKKLSADSEITVEVSNNAKSLINMGMAMAGLDPNAFDISWLKSVGLKFNSQMAGDNFGFDADLKLNDTKVISLNTIADFGKSIVFVKSPELCSKFIASKSVGDMGASKELMDRQLALLPNSKLIKDFLNESTSAILSGVANVERTEESISVSGVENKYDVLKFTMTKEIASSMATSYSKYLETSKSYEGLVEWINKIAEKNTSKEIYAKNFSRNVENFLLGTIGATVKIYPNSDGELAGLTIGDGSSDSFSWNTAAKGSDYGMEVSFKSGNAELFNLSGTGVYNNKKVSGKFTGKVSNSYGKLIDAFEMNTKDVSFSRIQADGSEEQVALTLRKDFLTNVIGLDSQTSSLVSGFSYVINTKAKKGSGNVKLTLADNQLEPYFSIALNSKVKTSASVSVPSEKDAIDENDKVAIMENYGNAELKTIAENLKKAGVPDNYVSFIENAKASDLMAMFGIR